MTGLLDKLIEQLKKLPGYAWLLIAATIIFSKLKGGSAELLAWQSALLAVVTWILYRLSAQLDRLYDWAYGPRETPRRLWLAKKLSCARKRAAVGLFQPIDPLVVNYETAVERRHVAKPKQVAKTPRSLYAQSVEVLKPTSVWEDDSAPLNEASKAARGLCLLSVLFLGSYLIPRQWLDVWQYVSPLVRYGLTGPLLMGTFLISFLTYWYARACHHILLYETMARRVIHYRVTNEEVALLAFDVSLRQTVPKASSEKDST